MKNDQVAAHLTNLCKFELNSIDPLGLIAIMGESRDKIRDIPAATEAFTLLQNALEKVPLVTDALSAPITDLTERIIYDHKSGKVIYFMNIEPELLDIKTFWLSGNLPEHIKKSPGTFVLLFSIENHEGVERLIPEWFSLFYVQSDVTQCVPILIFYAVLQHTEFTDWVPVSLHRAEYFNMPVEEALAIMSAVETAMVDHTQ